jgi:hypothetical protein
MCPTQTTVITTIVTTGIGGLIGYFSARRVSNLNARHLACTNFRKAFAPALATIYLAKKHRNYPGDEVPPFDVDRFLKEALLNQAAEIEVFRPHISKRKRTAYQETWEKYRYEVWNYGFDTTTLRHDVDDPWKIFEDLIHDILQFAEFKNK